MKVNMESGDMGSFMQTIQNALEGHDYNAAYRILEKYSDTISDVTKDSTYKLIRDKHRKKPVFHIGVIGDSLSLPRPDYMKHFDPFTNPKLIYSFENTYPYLLKKGIEKITDKDVVVSNTSNYGSKCFEVRDAVRSRLFFFNLDCIILQFGVVDCWPRGDDRKPWVSEGEFRAVAENIFSFFAEYAPSMPVIYLTVPNTIKSINDGRPFINDNISAYRNISLEVAAKYESIDVIDLEEHMCEGRDKFVHLDGHHLTKHGQRLCANLLAKKITSLAREIL